MWPAHAIHRERECLRELRFPSWLSFTVAAVYDRRKPALIERRYSKNSGSLRSFSSSGLWQRRRWWWWRRRSHFGCRHRRDRVLEDQLLLAVRLEDDRIFVEPFDLSN